MSILDKRLELIFDRLKSPKFLDSVSLSNDMPYWIFDYDPKDELTIRDYITKKLNPRFEKLEVAFHVINLYDVMLDMLEARQLIDRIPEREIKTGFDGLKKNLDSVLGVVSGNGKYSTLRIFTPTSFNDIQHGIFA